MKQSIGRPRKYEEREKEENPTESGFCWDEACVFL